MDVDKYSTEGKTVIGDITKLSRNPIQMKASIDNSISIASTSSYFDESAMKELRNNLTECTDYNSYEDTDDSDDEDCRKPLLKGSWDVSRMEYFQLMQTSENGQSKSEETKQIENIQLLHLASSTESADVEVFIVEEDKIENLSLHSYKELKEKGSNIGYDELELHGRYESIEAIENVVIDDQSEVSDVDEVNDTDESDNQSESIDVVIAKENEQSLVEGKDDETSEETVQESKDVENIQDENIQDAKINNDKEIESSLVVMKMKEVNISTEEKSCDKNEPVSETKGSKDELKLVYEAKTNDNLYFKTLEIKLRKLHDQACKNLQGSKAEKALKSFEEILSHLISEYGPKHKRVATALHNLAIVHLRLSNYEDAIDAIEEAIKIRKSRLGKTHPKVSDSLVELGIILSEMEEYDESLEAFSEALILREKEFDETNESDQGKVKLQMAKILNNIGCAYFELGELEDAATAFEEALDIQQTCYEEGNFQSMPGFLATSCTICNLGFVCMEGADYETAISHLEDSLKLQRNILDPNSFIIMSTLENLAFCYLKYGGLDKALRVSVIFALVILKHYFSTSSF